MFRSPEREPGGAFAHAQTHFRCHWPCLHRFKESDAHDTARRPSNPRPSVQPGAECAKWPRLATVSHTVPCAVAARWLTVGAFAPAIAASASAAVAVATLFRRRLDAICGYQQEFPAFQKTIAVRVCGLEQLLKAAVHLRNFVLREHVIMIGVVLQIMRHH